MEEWGLLYGSTHSARSLSIAIRSEQRRKKRGLGSARTTTVLDPAAKVFLLGNVLTSDEETDATT